MHCLPSSREPHFEHVCKSEQTGGRVIINIETKRRSNGHHVFYSRVRHGEKIRKKQSVSRTGDVFQEDNAGMSIRELIISGAFRVIDVMYDPSPVILRMGGIIPYN